MITTKLAVIVADKSATNMGEQALNENDIEKANDEKNNKNNRWYMINEKSLFPRIWRILIEWITIYCLFSHPFV